MIKKKILVTGGSGFIGSHVIDELVNRGHQVISADRSMNWQNDKAEYFELDITNKVRVDRLIKKLQPNLVIHLAGILGTSETWNHIHETIDSNIHGAINIYDACAKYNCDIVTVDVGSRWLSPYTITKTTGAEFAKGYGNKYDINVGILRIFNVYGPRQSTKIIKIVPKFIEMALKDSELQVWGNKNADLIHVKDVAKAFANAVEKIEKINGIEDIFIGSGEQFTVYDVAEMIGEKIGSGIIKQMNPRCGEEKAESGYMSNTKAKDILNWEPEINLEDGLNETIEWYKNKFMDTKNI